MIHYFNHCTYSLFQEIWRIIKNNYSIYYSNYALLNLLKICFPITKCILNIVLTDLQYIRYEKYFRYMYFFKK